MSDFIHLHTHSHYSILDGISKIDRIVEKTAEFGQNAVALTDHGNMFGIMEFRKKCEEHNKKEKGKDKPKLIKPIFGSELYIAPKSRFEKDKEEKYYHIVLLARDMDGYKNLIKLCSLGYMEGFYSKPRIDKDILAEHSKGLIVLTACLSGEIPRKVLDNREAELKAALDWYIQVFGKENFYLEVQNHKLPEEFQVTKKMLELSKVFGLQTVATNDSHYIERKDAKLQEIAFAIRDKRVLSDPDRYRFPNDEFYLKSPEEMKILFAEIPEALTNTLNIAEKCDVFFPEKPSHLPFFKIPDGETADDYTTRLCREGLARRFNGKPEEVYVKRLNLELELIKKMGFSNYFLIVSDYVRHAKETGVLVGPGRGSAAGALISYSLGITNIDPIKYNLLFERFLNPDRVTMPDIDTDFEDDRRDEIKEYIRAKYGYGKTADIITFNVLKSRAALKDVGRVMEIPLENVNRMTKFIDNQAANENLSTLVFGKNSEQKKTDPIPELKNAYEKADAAEKQWFDNAMELDGTIRTVGTHASGLIISDIDLTEIVPLYRDVQSGIISTQYEHGFLEENGLLKMDILGLSNLTMIKDSLNRIRKNHNVKLDINAIPLDDPKVYELFTRGETNGIFQFESGGMTDYMKKLRPTRVEDLIAMNALYRPGPMDNIPSYIARKQGREPVDCFHKNLEPILETTYGVIVYQEQVMQIAQVLAGFTLGRADVVRRIMAKKKPEELNKIRPEWVEGSVKNGYTKELAEKLFEILVPFSNYAFNKSHSAAYAILAYQIAYLKAHYRMEFMASLLSLNMGDSDKVRLYCQEAMSSGIRILPPDVNTSVWSFQESGNNIIFGFGAIKGLGEAMASAIVEERELGGKFTGFDNFISRIMKYSEFKKASVEILIKGGCFDSLFTAEECLREKAVLLHNLDFYVGQAQKHEKDKKTGQMGLFGTPENGGFDIHINKKVPPITIKDEFENELALFGFYLSGKLFSHHTGEFGRISSCSNNLIAKMKKGTGVLLWGFIHDVTIKIANNKKNYAIFSLDNGIDHFKFFVFSEKYEQFQNHIVDNNFVMMKIIVSEGRNGVQYEVSSVKPVSLIGKERFTQLHICLDGEDAPETMEKDLDSIRNLAADPRNRGIIQLVFHIISGQTSSSVQAAGKYNIKYDLKMMETISSLPTVKGYWFF